MTATTTTTPDWQPTLAGAFVHLRPIRADDREAMFAAASDPLIWAGHPASDRWTARQFRKYFDGVLGSGGALTIRGRWSGRIVGCSRYHDHDRQESRVEIGYTFLTRDCWGGSYNGEVKRLMLGHAFRFVETVQFAIARSNLRSCRAVEKIGATLTGRTEQRLTAGKLVRYCIYEVRRSGGSYVLGAD